jgi:hypothetical protein
MVEVGAPIKWGRSPHRERGPDLSPHPPTPQGGRGHYYPRSSNGLCVWSSPTAVLRRVKTATADPTGGRHGKGIDVVGLTRRPCWIINRTRYRSESTRVPLRQGRRLCVPKSEQYRRLAQACLELARRAEDQQARASLLHMAQVWFRLAEERVSEVDERQSAES